MRVSWRQLQPVDPRTLPPDAPDDRKYDFSVIDDALTKLAERDMRLTLRVYSYNSCCDAVVSQRHEYRDSRLGPRHSRCQHQLPRTARRLRRPAA